MALKNTCFEQLNLSKFGTHYPLTDVNQKIGGFLNQKKVKQHNQQHVQITQ